MFFYICNKAVFDFVFCFVCGVYQQQKVFEVLVKRQIL